MSVCEDCGQRLQQFRPFTQACPACGARHRARGNPPMWSGLAGGLFPVLWLLGLFLPGPLWLRIFAVPLIFVLGGSATALATQRWVRAGV